jgi:DNA (cytosine-5)-methyltransferase 1
MGKANLSASSPRKPAFLAVDFFCGAGGTTRGLIDAGGYVIAGVDKDARCAATYTENNFNDAVDYAPARFLEYDIFAAEPDYPRGQRIELESKLDSLLTYYRSKAKGVPLLFAICAPCQPFTRLARKELSEQRKKGREKDSHLLREAARFVARFKPEMVLSENVSGIGDPKYGGVWAEFRETLEALGYVTGSQIVCVSKFGVPQFRKRSILAAVRRDIVRPENLADILGRELLVPESDPNATVIGVAQAIGHMPPIAAGETHPVIPNHRARSLSDLNLQRLGSALPGESNAYMATTEHGDLSLECHRRVNERLQDRCFSDVYTRMRPG